MLIDPTKQPTDSEFDAFLDHMEQKVWGGALTAKAEADSYYFQTNDIWADYHKRNPQVDIAKRPKFRSGLFPSKVDQAVNAMLAFEPWLHRVPTGPGSDAEKAAGLLEKGTQALLHDCFGRAPNFPTKENGKQLILHNHTGLLTLLDLEGLIKPSQKEGEDKEDFQRREWEWQSSRQHWNPFKFVVPKAGEVLCDPMQAVPPVMVWRHRVAAYDLNDLLLKNAERYRRLGRVLSIWRTAWAGAFSMPSDPYEPVDVVEWWSMRWHGMKRKGGGAVYWEPNVTGIQPYSQVWGGNAISPTAEAFDVKWWVEQALMHKVIEEIVMEAQATAAHHQLLQRAAWAPIGTTEDAGEAAEQLNKGIVQGGKDDYWPFPVPDLPAQSFMHKEGLLRGIEQHTFSPLAAGLRESPTETATGVLTRAESTARGFKPYVAKAGHLWSLGSSNLLKMTVYLNREGGDAYKEFAEIGIGKDKVRVKDMGDPPQFHMQADFEQVDVAVQMQKTQEAVALYKEGLVSSDYVYRAARIEDPVGMRRELAEDRARNDPDVMEEMVINAFRVEGQLEIADRREQALKLRKLQRMMGLPPAAAPGAMQPGAPQSQVPTNGAGRMP